jgi:hypothetical protein
VTPVVSEHREVDSLRNQDRPFDGVAIHALRLATDSLTHLRPKGFATFLLAEEPFEQCSSGGTSGQASGAEATTRIAWTMEITARRRQDLRPPAPRTSGS